MGVGQPRLKQREQESRNKKIRFLGDFKLRYSKGNNLHKDQKNLEKLEEKKTLINLAIAIFGLRV